MVHFEPFSPESVCSVLSLLRIADLVLPLDPEDTPQKYLNSYEVAK